jgi:hypothetical protein
MNQLRNNLTMNLFLHDANEPLDDIYEYILNTALNVML